MTETTTRSKVTKLNKAPEAFSKQNESIINENIDKTQSNNKESIIAKSVKKIKEFFSTMTDIIFKLPAKLKTENGIKYAIASGIAVVCLIMCCLTCSVGYKVKIGSNALGVISSKKIYDETFQKINEEVFSLTGKEFTLSDDARFSMTISLKKDIQTKEEFEETLKSASSDMIPAYTVLVDNEMVVSLPNEKMALSLVDEYKNSFSLENNESNTEFINDVKVVYMFAPKSILYSKDSALEYLLDGEFTYYKSDCKQTISELAQKTGISKNTILKSNPLKSETISKGQIIKLYTGRMFADVKSVQNVTREESIPYETIEKDSADIYQGITRIETPGEDGVKSVSETVIYINGTETKREVLKEKVLKAPTSQIELIGTKEPPPSVGTGNLVMPTSGSLSSRFGSRWGRNHNGIDVSAPVGTPIYAADNGTVTYSQFNNGGYGYMIQIDHGNGIKTYYAHCSELLVNQGDVVAKGDLIAKVGNTGRSTGAHLHFEVLRDGTPVDPMGCID